MRNVLYSVLVLCLLASCGPSRYSVNVEMRHPSKAGVELGGKSISVVYVASGTDMNDVFSSSMADGFASSLELDYGLEKGSVGIFRIPSGGEMSPASKESMVSLLLDTGTDVVFLFDTVRFDAVSVGAQRKAEAFRPTDSSYVSVCSVPFTMKLYCMDAMDKSEEVMTFGGSSVINPVVYTDGAYTEQQIASAVVSGFSDEGYKVGALVAESFESQWKSEQYSIYCYDSERWYSALYYAERYEWKKAMDIWLDLLSSSDPVKRSCAAYNISTACYMLGDYALAKEWLDRSDSDCVQVLSEGLRKRIMQRL